MLHSLQNVAVFQTPVHKWQVVSACGSVYFNAVVGTAAKRWQQPACAVYVILLLNIDQNAAIYFKTVVGIAAKRLEIQHGVPRRPKTAWMPAFPPPLPPLSLFRFNFFSFFCPPEIDRPLGINRIHVCGRKIVTICEVQQDR